MKKSFVNASRYYAIPVMQLLIYRDSHDGKRILNADSGDQVKHTFCTIIILYIFLVTSYIDCGKTDGQLRVSEFEKILQPLDAIKIPGEIAEC